MLRLRVWRVIWALNHGYPTMTTKIEEIRALQARIAELEVVVAQLKRDKDRLGLFFTRLCCAFDDSLTELRKDGPLDDVPIDEAWLRAHGMID